MSEVDLDELEAMLEHDASCWPVNDVPARGKRCLEALRALRTEAAELRARDPKRLCTCGHAFDTHWPCGGCKVFNPVLFADRRDLICPCRTFKVAKLL